MVKFISNQQIPPKRTYFLVKDVDVAIREILKLKPTPLFEGDCVEVDFYPEILKQYFYRNHPAISITIRQIEKNIYRIWRLQ
jgi:hypothetical protein